jgi:hypothetical protein
MLFEAAGEQRGKLLPHFPPLNNSDVDKLVDYTLYILYIYKYDNFVAYNCKFIFMVKADLTTTKEILVIGNGFQHVIDSYIFGTCPSVTWP